MKKRILSLVLTLALLCTLLPAAALTAHAEVYSGTCGAEGDGSNLTWTLNTDTGILTINGSGAMADTPSWNNNRSDIKTVTLAGGVTSIGNYAFYDCLALTSVSIPNNVTSIGDYAFHNCDALTNITIPDGVTSIGNQTFSFCDNLTNVTIGSGLTSIGNGTFEACPSLTGFTVANTNAYLSNDASGVLFNKDKTSLLCYPAGKAGTYEIPDGVTSIGNYAFIKCYQLTDVTIPDSVTSIGDYAFNTCWGLTDVTIPDSVTSIGRTAFAFCINLANVTIPDSVTSIGSGAFGTCESLTSVTIPDSVTSIGESAFIACSSLKSVTLGNGVTNISSAMFERCHLLTDVTMGNNVTIIDRYAFNECKALTEVTIPDSVELISVNAFARCFGLTSVTIPDSVEQIGLKAFFDCPELTSVTIGKGVELIEDRAFGYYDDGVSSYAKVDGFTIYGYTGTSAPTYAERHGFTFISLGVAPIRFDDVAKDAYYADAVAWAVEHEITNGTSPTTFSPNSECTRGQVVTFLWRAKGCPEPTNPDNPFEDVEEGKFYYKAVLWAVENGITNGTGPTTFGPNNGCTRGQVVTFLWRTEGQPEPTSEANPFEDVTGGFYYKAVLWAVENKITAGVDATHFKPGNTCTRGQIVTFLWRDLG